MSASVATSLPDGFSLGSVLSRTFALLARRGLPFLLVMAVGQLPQQALRLWLPRPLSATGTLWLDMLLAGILAMLVIAITHGAVYHASFEDLQGRKGPIGPSLAVALGRFFPFVLVSFLYALILGIGFSLLIVPGAIAMTMFAVASPVCVIERASPWRSLGRSGVLTKGHRWKVLGLMLISGGGYLTTYAAQTLLGALFRPFGLPAPALVAIVLGAIAGMFGTTLYACMYQSLREAKEGVSADRLASVFD